MVFLLDFLNDSKHRAVEAAADAAGAGLGILVLMGVSGGLALLASGLVCFVAPVCAGGGVPELKGYIDGNLIPGLFNAVTLPVRALGIVLVLAAGLPYGREGPTMCVGVNLAIILMKGLGLPRLHHKVDMTGSGMGRVSPALVVDEERYAHARRLACAVGGSAGMAVIFNSPIGGLLYFLEECTVTNWVPEATAHAAVATVCCTLATIGLLRISDRNVHEFFIYVGQDQRYEWQWVDMPLLALFAALIGLFSAAYMHALLLVQRLRRQLHAALRWQPWAKILEVLLYAMVCAATLGLVSLVGDCHRGDARGFAVRRFGCAEGEWNSLATLLLNDTGSAIEFLYRPEYFGVCTLMTVGVAVVVYTILNIGAMGLPVPYGSFIPAMFIGALLGRFLGGCMAAAVPDFRRFSIYALAGSGALLGAFTRKTLSIVVFLVEAVHDFECIPPVLLVVVVAYLVTRAVSHHGLDERLILMKGVPFLDEEIPHGLDDARVTALDLCEALPEATILPREAPTSRLRSALDHWEVEHFPVVEGGICVGLTTRLRLQAALAAHGGMREEGVGGGSSSSRGSRGGSSGSGSSSAAEDLEEEDAEGGSGGALAAGFISDRSLSAPGRGLADQEVPIFRVMDPVPYIVTEDTPAPRVYPLFTRLGAAAVCVVSARGEFRAVLSRGGVVAATRPSWTSASMRAAAHGAATSPTDQVPAETDMEVLTFQSHLNHVDPLDV